MRKDEKNTKKLCEIPFCDGEASYTVKIGKNQVRFCEKHFNQSMIPVEMKRKIDEDWLTEERKRRIFNPTIQEKIIMEYLVERGVLEDMAWSGKASYRPTENFYNLVAEAEVNLMLKGYMASMYTQMEEGARIAIRQSIPDAGAEEVEKYTEIVCPFILFDRMDRDLNPQSDRYKYR